MTSRESSLTQSVIRVASPVREQVTAALRRAILDFEFTPGQRLVERELVELLGVSRATVREALGELKTEGLVTVIPQRGAIVSIPDAKQAADLYDMRARMESLVLERFTLQATNSQAIAFEAAVEAFAEAVAEGAANHELLRRRDAMFTVLLEGAGSAVLEQITTMLQARVNILRATSISDPERLQASVEEWRSLARAIRARDLEAALRIYADHFDKAAQLALASITAPKDADSGGT